MESLEKKRKQWDKEIGYARQRLEQQKQEAVAEAEQLEAENKVRCLCHALTRHVLVGTRWHAVSEPRGDVLCARRLWTVTKPAGLRTARLVW